MQQQNSVPVNSTRALANELLYGGKTPQQFQATNSFAPNQPMYAQTQQPTSFGVNTLIQNQQAMMMTQQPISYGASTLMNSNTNPNAGMFPAFR